MSFVTSFGIVSLDDGVAFVLLLQFVKIILTKKTAIVTEVKFFFNLDSILNSF